MATYEISITTSTASASVQADASSVPGADGRSRVVCSCDEVGRGVAVTIRPLSADTQFVLHSLRAYVTPSVAMPDDA